jgi:putative SOS response-associated peptidase YedK
MCGRAACTLAPEELQKQTQAKKFEDAEDYKPSYNIGPHQMHVVMLLDSDEQPILKLMRWGLVRPPCPCECVCECVCVA